MNIASNINYMIGRVKYFLMNLMRLPNMYTNTEVNLRERVSILLDLYKGIQLTHLKKSLDEQFANPSFLKMQLQISNITRFITDSLAQTTKNGIIITPENELEAEIVDEIADSTKFESFMQSLEKYLFLCKTVFVKVSWREDQIKLDLITPTFVDITQSITNPDTFSELVYPQMITKQSISNPEGSFHFWSNDEYKLVNETGLTIPVEGADGTNPYGIIPVVMFNEILPIDGEILQFPGEELYNAQMSINTKLTELNQLIKMQTFSIPVYVNPTEDQYGNMDITLDPSKPIVVHGDKDKMGDVKFITPDAKIQDVMSALEKEYLRIGALFGVDVSSFVNSAAKSSADAMVEMNSKVSEYRTAMRTMLTPKMNELWEVIKVVYFTHTGKQLGDVTIEVQDAKRSEPSVDDKIKMNDWLLGHDMTTVIDLLIAERADIDMDEAEEKIIANIEKNSELKALKTPETNTNNTAKQGVKMDTQNEGDTNGDSNITDNGADSNDGTDNTGNRE